MKLKIFYPVLLLMFSSMALSAQSRVITTAAPFLNIPPDARAAGMGDVGVATSPDAYSQFWNPSKYAFSKSSSSIGISYTPWLNELVNDIFVGYVSGFYKLNDRSVMSSSMRYFALGEIMLTDDVGNTQGSVNPNEFSFDLAYSIKLDKKFSMGVGLRYIHSNANTAGFNTNNDVIAGQSVGVDVSGYYLADLVKYRDFEGQFSFGWNISNIGLKLTYNKNATEEQKNFIPTNLKIGSGYKFKFDQYNVLNVNLDINKLLVPTPPIRDLQGNITEGKDDQVGSIQGIFQSFYDAPGGMTEELAELSYGLGGEYVYDDTFALRSGYFHEDVTKGNRKYATIGFGFYYSSLSLDFSYLINTSRVRSPLENTLRFSLTIDFDKFSLFDQLGD